MGCLADHCLVQVLVVSDAYHIIGVDVMKVQCQPPVSNTADNVADFFDRFTCVFTAAEWKVIMQAIGPRDKLEQFYTFWTLKEAYLKAIGLALGACACHAATLPSLVL